MQSFLSSIKHIEDSYGPRITGTESDHKTIDFIEQTFRSHSNNVTTQKFKVVGRALQHLIQFLVWGYFISVISYAFLAPLALGLALSMLLIYYLARFKGLNLINLFFKKSETKNVIATFDPVEEKKGVVIFSGHHDSAFHMPLFEKKLAHIALIQNSAILGIVMLVVSSIWKTITLFVPASGILGTELNIGNATITDIYLLPDLIYLLAVLGLIPAFYFLSNMVTNTPLIGANDNLTSVAMLFALGEYFSENPPKNLEVRLISFGAEEPGLVGSSLYVKTHYDDLINAININYETLGSGTLGVIAKEKDNNITHNKKFVNFIQDVGKDNGMDIKGIEIHFGNTDAGSFTKKGMKATTIFSYGKNDVFDLWHSLDDKVENLDEDLIQQAYDLTIHIINTLEDNTSIFE